MGKTAAGGRRARSWAPRRGRARSGARTLFVAALAVAATGATSTPSWAATTPARHRLTGTTTTTTTDTPAGTTTVPTTMPLPQSPPPAPEDTCAKGTWAPQYEGRPAVFLTGSDGAYLWHDADGGWALRVTHASAKVRVVFSGSLYSAAGQFIDVSQVDAGGLDIVYETGNKHTVYFRFVNTGLVDGLNFATSCAKTFTVNIHQGPRLAPVGEVYLGASAVNAPTNPFRVQRVKAQGSDAKLTGLTTTTTTTPPTTPPASTASSPYRARRSAAGVV